MIFSLKENSFRVLKHEEYNSDNEIGIIDIVGEWERVLLFNSHIKIVAWPRNEGFYANEYIMLSDQYRQTEKEVVLKELNDVIETGIPEDKTIIEVFRPVLSLLSKGRYYLWYCDPLKDIDEYNLIQSSKYYYQIFELYKSKTDDIELYTRKYNIYSFTLISTRYADDINAERVIYYMDKIRQGVRPVIICIGTYWRSNFFQEFILDGNHKAIAYKLSGIMPRVLAIEKITGFSSMESNSDIKLGSLLSKAQIEYIKKNKYLNNLE
jgi:hypothetical protein